MCTSTHNAWRSLTNTDRTRLTFRASLTDRAIEPEIVWSVAPGVSFSFAPTRSVVENDWVTATATNKAMGDTSEFSEATQVTGPTSGGG